MCHKFVKICQIKKRIWRYSLNGPIRAIYQIEQKRSQGCGQESELGGINK